MLHEHGMRFECLHQADSGPNAGSAPTAHPFQLRIRHTLNLFAWMTVSRRVLSWRKLDTFAHHTASVVSSMPLPRPLVGTTTLAAAAAFRSKLACQVLRTLHFLVPQNLESATPLPCATHFASSGVHYQGQHHSCPPFLGSRSAQLYSSVKTTVMQGWRAPFLLSGHLPDLRSFDQRNRLKCFPIFRGPRTRTNALLGFSTRFMCMTWSARAADVDSIYTSDQLLTTNC